MYLFFVQCNIDEIYNNTFPPDQPAIRRAEPGSPGTGPANLLSCPLPSLCEGSTLPPASLRDQHACNSSHASNVLWSLLRPIGIIQIAPRPTCPRDSGDHGTGEEIAQKGKRFFEASVAGAIPSTSSSSRDPDLDRSAVRG
jgi:hypothetical protein